MPSVFVCHLPKKGAGTPCAPKDYKTERPRTFLHSPGSPWMKNCPTGSGISRDSFFCSTNLALTPKRTIAKGVDNQEYLLNE